MSGSIAQKSLSLPARVADNTVCGIFGSFFYKNNDFRKYINMLNPANGNSVGRSVGSNVDAADWSVSTIPIAPLNRRATPVSALLFLLDSIVGTSGADIDDISEFEPGIAELVLFEEELTPLCSFKRLNPRSGGICLTKKRGN